MKIVNKKINLEEIKKENLKSILSARGIIFRHYLKRQRQKRQSIRLALPKI